MLSSFAIGATDSWFAATTTALNIALVVPSGNVTRSFGRSLQSECVSELWQQKQCPSNAQAACRYPCSIMSWNTSVGQEREGVSNAQQAAETLMSRSLNNTVMNITANGTNYYFLGDVGANAELDFSAAALAVSTQCRMVTPNCTLDGHGFTCGAYAAPSFSYSGSVGFAPGDVTSPSDMAMVGVQFFHDTTWDRPAGFGDDTTDLFATQNPIHFLTWSKGFPPMNTYGDQFPAMREGKYYQYDDTGDTVYILDCSTSIYDAEYYWVNGTVASVEVDGDGNGLAPDYYGAVLSAPFGTNTALSHLSLQDASALAAYQKDPGDLSLVYSNYFSRAAVALTSGFSVAVLNERESTRTNSYLATRVPWVPLYTLVALKAVYAAFALGLAFLAVFLTHPSQAQEIKERLTVDGLAAAFFEPCAQHEQAVKNVQDLFEEHQDSEPSDDTKRVGMLQTKQGGWQWVTLAKRASDGLGLQGIVDLAAEQAAGQQGAVGQAAQGFTLVKEII